MFPGVRTRLSILRKRTDQYPEHCMYKVQATINFEPDQVDVQQSWCNCSIILNHSTRVVDANTQTYTARSLNDASGLVKQ